IGFPTQFHIITYAPLHPCPLPIQARLTLWSDVGFLRPMQSNSTPVARRWCVSLIECCCVASQSRKTLGPGTCDCVMNVCRPNFHADLRDPPGELVAIEKSAAVVGGEIVEQRNVERDLGLA